MGASSAARAARIAAELGGMPYLRLLRWDDRRRDGVRMFIAHMEPTTRAQFALMAEEEGCSVESLIYRICADRIQAWMGGKD